ncbi:unnamed protein product, partial [Prunus brigantina]
MSMILFSQVQTLMLFKRLLQILVQCLISRTWVLLPSFLAYRFRLSRMVTFLSVNKNGEPLKEPSVYRSIVGALRYLTFTRPDLAYSVNTVANLCTIPQRFIFSWLKGFCATFKALCTMVLLTLRLFQFLCLHIVMQIGLGILPLDDQPQDLLSSWVPIQFHGSLRSEGPSPVAPPKPNTVLLLMLQQRSLGFVGYLRIFMSFSRILLSLFCDNMSALALGSNPIFHSRIKHLDVDFHFVRERVQRKDFLVHYIPTDE